MSRLEKETKLYAQFLRVLFQDHSYIVSVVNNQGVRQQQLEFLCSICVKVLTGESEDPKISEQRLLAFLLLVLREYFDKTLDPTNFLRGNDFAYKLLHTYMQQVGSDDALRKTLGAPLSDLMKEDNPDMELDPLTIYRNLGYQGGNAASQRELASNPEVSARRDANLERLKKFCVIVADSIFSDVDKYPMGLRYVGSYLAKLSSDHDVSEAKRNSIVGGYIYLRFIIPAIVGPEKYGIAEPQAISTQIRQSLITLSKVMRQLWSGSVYPDDDKNWFMTPLNDFLVEYQEKQNDFIGRFIDVDIGHLTSIDNPDRTIGICVNDVYFLHKICQTTLDKMNLGEADLLRQLIVALKEVPEEVPPKKNKEVHLRLCEGEVSASEGLMRANSIQKLLSVLKRLTKQQ